MTGLICFVFSSLRRMSSQKKIKKPNEDVSLDGGSLKSRHVFICYSPVYYFIPINVFSVNVFHSHTALSTLPTTNSSTWNLDNGSGARSGMLYIHCTICMLCCCTF
jgi:hypothetical protein